MLRRLGRSPFAAQQRKAQQQAEEAEASRLLLLGGAAGARLPDRLGRGKRKLQSREEEEEEESAAAGGLVVAAAAGAEYSEDEEEQEAHRQWQRRQQSWGGDELSPGPGDADIDVDMAPAGMDDLSPHALPQRQHPLQQRDTPGSGATPGVQLLGEAATARAAGEGGQPQKQKRVLRWIRRSVTVSPEKDDEEAAGADGQQQEGEAGEEGAERVARTRSLVELQTEVDAAAGSSGRGAQPAMKAEQERQLPLLLPLQRAADAAESAAAAAERAAAARQAAMIAGSAVGPRMLGLAPVAVKRRAPGGLRVAGGGGGGGEEPPGLRSPTGKHWMQVGPACLSPPACCVAGWRLL